MQDSDDLLVLCKHMHDRFLRQKKQANHEASDYHRRKNGNSVVNFRLPRGALPDAVADQNEAGHLNANVADLRELPHVALD